MTVIMMIKIKVVSVVVQRRYVCGPLLEVEVTEQVELTRIVLQIDL